MKKIILIPVILFALQGHAQNRLLTLKPGESIGNIQRLRDYDALGTFDYHIPKTPVQVAGAFPYNANLHSLANNAVNDFQTLHLNGYGMSPQYSLWLNADIRILGSSDYVYTTYAEDQAITERMRQAICSNKILQEAIYAWLMPAYKEAFAEMSVPEQTAYLAIFRNALTYLDTMNLARETAAAKNIDVDFRYSRGDLNAFIFRRLNKNELTKEDCVSWLNRIIKDFESVQRKNPTLADNYFLNKDLDDEYFLGEIFISEYDEQDHTAHMFRKRNGQMEILPFGIDYVRYEEPGLMVANPSDSTSETLIVRYDSSGCRTTNCPVYIAPQASMMVGNSQNERFMFISGWEEIPDLKYGDKMMAICQVVDADSGFVVADTFLVSANVSGGYYSEKYEFPGFDKNHIIFYSPEKQLYGMMDAFGNIILPAKYKSLEPTEDPLVYKANGKKKVHIKR